MDTMFLQFEDNIEGKKILDKKVEKRITYYLIWWKNYSNDRSTWEPKSSLIQNGLKDLINDFEYKNKKPKVKA